MASVDLTSVQELLGHKSLNMTLRYAHLAPEHKTKAVKKHDEVLKNTEEKDFSSQFGSQFTQDSNSELVNPCKVRVSEGIRTPDPQNHNLKSKDC
jgi:hypothetical protein